MIRPLHSLVFLTLTCLLMPAASRADDVSPVATQPDFARAGCVASGFMADFDVIGEHGMEHEPEKRDIAGKAVAVAFKDGDSIQLITLFRPNASEKVLVGCPFSFYRITRTGELSSEGEFRIAYACRLLNNVLIPRNIVKTEERVSDLLQEVPVIDSSIAANLKVQTIPDRNGPGWVRTEQLARDSDPKMLPPGRSQLIAWSGKFEVDGRSLLSLGEVAYKLRVSDQGNSIILVTTRVTRTKLTELTSPQIASLQADAPVLKSIARDWVNDRGRAMKSVNYLLEKSKNSIFADYYPWLKKQLEEDIRKMGERDKWREPRTGRLPPGGIPATQQAPVPIPSH